MSSILEGHTSYQSLHSSASTMFTSITPTSMVSKATYGA